MYNHKEFLDLSRQEKDRHSHRIYNFQTEEGKEEKIITSIGVEYLLKNVDPALREAVEKAVLTPYAQMRQDRNVVTWIRYYRKGGGHFVDLSSGMQGKPVHSFSIPVTVPVIEGFELVLRKDTSSPFHTAQRGALLLPKSLA